MSAETPNPPRATSPAVEAPLADDPIDERLIEAGALNPKESTFDYVIVGSGAGGGPLAARLALAGKKVLVIEAGGDPIAAKSRTHKGPNLTQLRLLLRGFRPVFWLLRFLSWFWGERIKLQARLEYQGGCGFLHRSSIPNPHQVSHWR